MKNNREFPFHRRLRIAATLLALVVAPPLLYAEELDNLEFRGTLIAPPACTVGTEETVTVDFGNAVSISKIETGVYREPINLQLVCADTGADWHITLTWNGRPVPFDDDDATVMTEEQENLGIKLYANERPFVRGTALDISEISRQKLEAVLVKNAGAILQEGPFSAQATIRIEFQ